MADKEKENLKAYSNTGRPNQDHGVRNLKNGRVKPRQWAHEVAVDIEKACAQMDKGPRLFRQHPKAQHGRKIICAYQKAT